MRIALLTHLERITNIMTHRYCFCFCYCFYYFLLFLNLSLGSNLDANTNTAASVISNLKSDLFNFISSNYDFHYDFRHLICFSFDYMKTSNALDLISK